MERVVIIGSAGAGKTDLAIKLSRRTGLPVVHLDVLFWGPRWTRIPRDLALQRLAEHLAGDRWIVDGNFLSSVGADARFDRRTRSSFSTFPAVCVCGGS